MIPNTFSTAILLFVRSGFCPFARAIVHVSSLDVENLSFQHVRALIARSVLRCSVAEKRGVSFGEAEEREGG
jgi:hypothetical protein